MAALQGASDRVKQYSCAIFFPFFVSFKPKLLMLLLMIIMSSTVAEGRDNRIIAHDEDDGTKFYGSKPTSIVFYQHEVRGTTPDANVRAITNSPLGSLVVVDNMPLTETLDPSSKPVGSWYGTGSSTTPSTMIFVLQDYHVQWPERNLNGTFLVQSAVNRLDPVRKLVIVGGTGSFDLARGYTLTSFVTGDHSTPKHTVRIEAYFDFSCGRRSGESTVRSTTTQ